MKQLCKYFLIVVLFLLPGIIIYCNIAAADISVEITEEQPLVCSLSEDIVSVNQIYTVFVDTFSAIRQVESLRIEGSNVYRDFLKVMHVSPDNVHPYSLGVIDEGDFSRLLSERHYIGFYIYFRKLII